LRLSLSVIKYFNNKLAWLRGTIFTHTTPYWPPTPWLVQLLVTRTGPGRIPSGCLPSVTITQ